MTIEWEIQVNMSDGQSFENVLLFVSDSLRYDAAQQIFDDQQVIKTIAAGTWSPLSFASIISGQSAGQHSVLSFNHKLDPNISTIFDFVDNCSFVNQGKQLGHVLGTEEKVPSVSLDEIEPPFLYMERCLLPHAPYNYAEDTYLGSVRDYCISNHQTIHSDYTAAAQSSIEKFQKRIDTLRERDLLEDTLVILTSDHGENLGEHGLYGHGSTTTPELVNVPTVFFNYDLSCNGIGHIDIYTTIGGVFKKEISEEYRGCNLLKTTPEDRLLLNRSRHGEYSAWDVNGGYVFYDKSVFWKVGWWGYHLIKNPYAKLNRQHPVELFRTAMAGGIQGVRCWGQPEFKKEDAEAFCERELAKQSTIRKRELDRKSEEQLRDLGYI